jgi:lysophospholipase L1-like esterase
MTGEAKGTVGAPRRRTGISCYAALGDSFTAGTGVPSKARWADRLARSLAAADEDLVYRNFAFEGATSADVLEQVGAAIQLEPDLVTVVCGANDVLLSVRPDLDGFERRLGQILDRLADVVEDCRLLTATVPEQWRFLELRPRTRRRVSLGLRGVNAAIREAAAERGVPCLEMTGHPGLADRANFSPDGLHPSELGHERVTAAFEAALAGAVDPRTRGDA